MGMMSIVVLAALMVVVAVLFAGLLAMGRQGKDAARLSNKLMRLRILTQFAALALIVLLAILGGR